MVTIKKSPLILVDGSLYLYRAYHTFPFLSNTNKEPTGAIYGVVNMLRSLLLQYNPSHMVVVFDDKGKNFRDTLFAPYKSHRLPMPDTLRLQIKPLYNLLRALGLPLLVKAGVEADDVIGTLAQQAEKAGHAVLISTSDKDMAQLVTSNITLINTMNNTLLGPQEVCNKYGVPPELIIDFLALIGDSSDNIPGVPGIGKKTAQALLQEIGGLDILFKNLNNIATLTFRGAKTLAAKLQQNKELAYLSYQLATIKTDVKLNITYDKLQIMFPDINKLHQLLSRYEFKHLLVKLESGNLLSNKKSKLKVKINRFSLVEKHAIVNIPRITYQLLPKNYKIILDIKTLSTWINQLNQIDLFVFDTKTDSLNILNANLIGLSFAIAKGEAAYLPLAHDYLGVPNQLDRDQVLSMLKPLLENKQIHKAGQNLKFNKNILANYNINLKGIMFDVMLESYVLNSTNHHDIASLAQHYLHYKTINFKDIIGKGKKQLTFNQISLEQASFYAAEDADITLQLHKILWLKLQQNNALMRIFQDIEMPLLEILSCIERTGVLIESSILIKLSKELTIRLVDLETQAHFLAGESFNLASPKQLQFILYEKQKFPIQKKTPRSAPSTDEEVLTKLALNHPLPKVLLKYRSLAKLKTTYTDKFPLMINPLSGRIHTSYHQTITTTGRLSSRDPNLQNIPIRNKEGRRIRQAFIAAPHYYILAADYSQIELRIMAHLSQDPGLINAFATNQDIHCATAAEVFTIPLDNVTINQRRSAKIINFGLIYGMSAFGLARQLGITHIKAQKYINLYFERYPKVIDYIERTRKQAAEQGYVTTLEGRRLYLLDIQSRHVMQRKAAEREAINAPIQGSAADIIKRAMIKINIWLQQETKLRIRIIMQVHDELVFEINKHDLDKAKLKIRTLMEEQSIQLMVPLRVNIGVGDNWDEAYP
ncbi:DNA polymerase I [Candidatus Fukatsuia anoeciicola]|uniref:DNA polymerase I n=1 Tax=Candidatus Fukatsuia anoeciicola TaxID=2994492 RepID=UPI0034643415